MRSRASIGGHPLHPVLVVVPLGALPTALVFDVLGALSPGGSWGLAAIVATLLGEAVLLLALVPGVVDYVTSLPPDEETRSTATRHMSLGFSLAAFYAILLALRLLAQGLGSTALATLVTLLSVLGVAALALQAWLGLGLVTARGVGVEDPGEPPADAEGPARAGARRRGRGERAP